MGSDEVPGWWTIGSGLLSLVALAVGIPPLLDLLLGRPRLSMSLEVRGGDRVEGSHYVFVSVQMVPRW